MEQPAEALTIAELSVGDAETAAVPLPRLTATLRSPAPDVAELAAHVVGTLAREPSARDPLGESPGLLAALVELLARGNPGSMAGEAARAIANLVFDHPANRAALLSLGVVPPLVAAYRSAVAARSPDGAAVVRFCTAAVGNLASDSPALQTAIAHAGCLPLLVSALQDISSDAAPLAARALGNMAESAEVAKQAVECGVLRALSESLRAVAAEVGHPLRPRCLEALSAFVTATDSAWRTTLVCECGFADVLLQLASGNTLEDDDEEEEEEPGLEPGQCLAESAALLLVGLCADTRLAESAQLGGMAVLRCADAAMAPRPGRKLPGRDAARRQLARVVACLCAASPVVAEDVCIKQATLLQAVLRLAELEKDDGIRIHGVSALAVLATSEPRCTAIAAARCPTNGMPVPEMLLAVVRNAKDGDAVALRALATLQNLGVPPDTRAVLLALGAPEIIAGCLQRFTNPLLLFSTVLVARHLCGPVPQDITVAIDTIPPSPGAEALARSGAISQLAALARCERGVPEPDKIEAKPDGEDEDGAAGTSASAEAVQAAAAAAAAAATPPAQQKRDIRVALESTRLLARMCLWSAELRKDVLAQNGILAAFATTLRSGFDILQAETVRGLIVCCNAAHDTLIQLPGIDDLRAALAELHNDDATTLLTRMS